MNPELEFHTGVRRKEPTRFLLRTVFWILASGACYYLTTRIAWVLCLPDSKISLFFPPHAVLVSVLLLVPTRHWWAYTVAAAGCHFIAAQQAYWPISYALHSEVFDAVKNVSAAAGIRILIRSPFHLITLREAIIFVSIAVVIVPFGTAFWGAALTVSYHFGTDYWVEWRIMGMSNAVTAIVLIPAILLGAHHISVKGIRVAPGRILEAGFLGVGILTVGVFAFDRLSAGPGTSPAFLYAPIPLLIWAALRFGVGGMSASMLVITVQAIWGIIHGRGPFLAQSPAENMLAFHMFFLMAATPLMLLAVAIEDERRSKEALRISEERMSLAAESAQLALWEWDMARDEVWMSDEGRKFFGIEPDERIDYASMAGRVHPDDRAARAAAIQRARKNDGSYEAEYRIVLPNGSVRWIAARGRSLHVGNIAPPRILGVSMDITRQKQAAAEAQQQREELEHLSRVASLGVLTGSLAHELNQPLGAILRNAEAAELFLQSDAPDLDELRAIVRDIRKDDQRAGGVIDRLRALLKRRKFEPCPVALAELVGEVVALTRADCENRLIVIALDLPPDLPLVRGDRIHLQQVILNLLINGMDALSEANGERSLVLRARPDGAGFVEVAVNDNGTGIPAENLARLFEPFFTTKTQGMGLGLAISRTIIESHGGRLWAENNAKRGATFRFTVPIADGGAV